MASGGRGEDPRIAEEVSEQSRLTRSMFAVPDALGWASLPPRMIPSQGVPGPPPFAGCVAWENRAVEQAAMQPIQGCVALLISDDEKS